MDIETLRSFVVVARAGSITRAAEELYVTQPTLSRRIAVLEDELGVQLFDREHGGVRLTPAGTRLSREAEEIVSRVAALPLLLGEVASPQEPEHEGLTGTLRVGAQSMLDDTLVSRFMGSLMAANPALEVQIRHAYPPEIRHQLALGNYDVAFFLRPVGTSISQLLTRRVGESRLQLLVYDAHPFARRMSVDIHELAGEDIVMLERRISPEIVDFFSARCVEAGFSLNAVRYVRDIENAAVLVSAGRGISFAHSMMTFAQPLETVGLRLVDITGADVAIDYVARLRTGLSDEMRDAVLDVLDCLERQ